MRQSHGRTDCSRSCTFKALNTASGRSAKFGWFFGAQMGLIATDAKAAGEAADALFSRLDHASERDTGVGSEGAGGRESGSSTQP